MLAHSLNMLTASAHDFERRAAEYDDHASVQREAAAWLAEWLPAKIEGPAVELGAGTGLFTRHLAARAGGLAATDASPAMVRAGAAAVPSARWSVADATRPPDTHRYLWVFSCSLVQWLPDPAAAFRAWHRFSAPGARLFAGWFIRGTLREFFAACPEASPFLWRDAAEWEDLLARSGWKVERSETRSFRREDKDSAGMLRKIHNSGAAVPRRLGAGRLRRALREHDRAQGNGRGVQTNFEFLRVEAVKQ
jgi:malonyl-CoA O-methyltransferase